MDNLKVIGASNFSDIDNLGHWLLTTPSTLLSTVTCLTWSYLQSGSFILLAICLVTINLIVVLGNTLVVLAACTSAKLQNALTSTFVVSLALSDLLLGAAVLPFSTVHQLLLKHWVFGSRWCQIWLATDVWTCTASILNLVIISLDRYLSLCHPLKYPKLMNRRRARGMVAGVWILASAISLPTLLAGSASNQHELENDADNGTSGVTSDKPTGCLRLGPTCTIAQSERGYIVYSALGSFFIPFLVVTYLYAKICSVVHRTLRAGRMGTVTVQARRQYGELRVHRGGGGGSGGGEGQTGAPLFSARYGRELKAARMLAIICVAFVGCWAPFFSVYLSGAACPGCVPPRVFDFCFWLGYLNSALNPFIYAFFSADYRRAFKALIVRLWRARPVPGFCSKRRSGGGGAGGGVIGGAASGGIAGSSGASRLMTTPKREGFGSFSAETQA